MEPDIYHWMKALALVYFTAWMTVQCLMALYHRALNALNK